LSSSLEAVAVARLRPAPAAGEGFFGLVYRRSLIYNQCWEDPALDREALRLAPQDRVIAITSAGCNVLDYALTGARVLAVDANPRQNHLLELKLAGIRRLDHAGFFELFGRGASRRARDLYHDALRGELSPAARGFWDAAIAAFDPAEARGGSFYYTGTAGFFAHAVRRYVDVVPGLRRAVDAVMDAPDLEVQRARFEREVRPRLLRRGLLACVGSPWALALLGVPSPQRRLVAGHSGGVAGFLSASLEHVVALGLLRENYFWSVYVTGRYDARCCPAYLKPEGFARLKAGLSGNVSLRTGTVAQVLARERDLTAFVLLDHMDWLADAPALLADEWRSIFGAAAGGARVIFRSGGPDAGFLPGWVGERLDFDRERAAALHARDRVGTYGSFHIARIGNA
jgi:S-adenosylmethionine-diacylglycerol 3-amino-3-carboxypropyl transferase